MYQRHQKTREPRTREPRIKEPRMRDPRTRAPKTVTTRDFLSVQTLSMPTTLYMSRAWNSFHVKLLSGARHCRKDWRMERTVFLSTKSLSLGKSIHKNNAAYVITLSFSVRYDQVVAR
jgi:hypothetical protein